ncbi:MAG: prolyl oligopeptidase family serine peptidase [Lentisphaerae bacterium]|nr:prolyl oligopeptidase family serine peptidase [Lentisphaerota bacterium]
MSKSCQRLLAVLVVVGSFGCKAQFLEIGPAPAVVEAPAAAPAAAGRSDVEAALAPYEDVDWRPGTPSERTLVPYAMLQMRKIRMLRDSPYGATAGQSLQERLLEQARTALAEARAGKVLRARPGQLSELAYITGNDHTVQPYYLYLPKAYDPSRPWPLMVFLHGYVPTISIMDPWLLSQEAYDVADRHGFILLTVYGRRNTDFQGVGEVDVEEATREVQDLYAVDPERVHLTGVSMGGAGAYYIGLRRPGRYASISTMDGQTDMHAWWPLILRDWPRSRDDIPAFRRWLVELDNPVDLVMNARNQHLFVLHGENDPLVPVAQSRTMVDLARAQGIELEYCEVPGAGHYIYWDPAILDKAWGWQKAFRRQPSPPRVTFKTFSLEYDRAYWCRIGDFVRWGIPATLDCRVAPDGSGLLATTANVRLLVIDAKAVPLDTAAGLKAVVNGVERTASRNAAGDFEIVCEEPAAAPAGATPAADAWPPRKRHGLSGPIEEAFDGPFVVVTGTAGNDDEDRRLAAQVERWADEWDRFADGRPPVLLDSQVTEAVIARRNLVLFGTPESNLILARLHDRLPVRIGPQRYEVAGKTYEGPDLGMVLCYPNPLNPQRYVVVYAGALYGERCGINHKHDLLPDFIVFNTRRFNYDDTNEHEVAGFFDMAWRLAPELTWERKKE